MKTCNKCGCSKSEKDFGNHHFCRECTAVYQYEYDRRPDVKARKASAARARYASNPERRKSANLIWKYGVSPEQMADQLARQGGCCAICGTREPSGRGWVVDHDHGCCPGIRACGSCLRGVLCTKCNTILGLANDDKNTLARAIEYLEEAAWPTATGAIEPPLAQRRSVVLAA